MNVVDVYMQTIKSMPAADRLRLAAMILNDIPPQSMVDYSEEWTEEDCRDAARASWTRAERSLGETSDG